MRHVKLDMTLGDFFYKYGRNKTNRLLFYYAGHGHTQQMFTGEALGYLVMVDAPVPEKDPVGFNISNVDMQTIVTQAKMTRAKHVLFMFDSCFSGSILNLRERVVPEAISESVSLPVRQFITAGRANEPVPDHSIFKQAFLDLLEGRDKEPIPDGYITGEELGLYLKNKVPEYNPTQHPQYGKIKDIRLDKGDFVFSLKIPSKLQQPGTVQSSGIRDYDKIIEEREANRKKWNSWQERFETELAKVERYDKSNVLNAEEKAQAWEGLLATYSDDNPYSVKDDEFRSKAAKNVRVWKKIEEIKNLIRQGNLDKAEEVKAEELINLIRQVNSDKSEEIKKELLELVLNFEKPSVKDPGARLLQFGSVSGVFVDTEKSGPLFVIRGMVTNKYPESRRYIKLKGSILDSKGIVVIAKTVYAGNTFSEEELKKLPLDEIFKAAENREGMARQNANVASGNTIPFMVVFAKLSDDLSEFTVEAVSSSPFESSTSDVKGKLFVETVPANAKVRILNIGPKFYQGMELKPGRYHVEASKRGYQTKKMWVNLGAGEDKKVAVDLEQLQASIQPTTTHARRPSSTSNEIERDGIYVAYANGIVKDTKTGLEWKVGPDRDTDWNEARLWVQSLNLDGGGWRMPTMDELEGLYKKGKGDWNMTPLLKNTGYFVWSGETRGSSDAWAVNFGDGYRTWGYRPAPGSRRAFAVRSRGDG